MGDGDPSCYFRLAAACPDRGVMGGKEGGGIFWTKNKIGFYSFSFAWTEGWGNAREEPTLVSRHPSFHP